ncbi:regulatory signaling modulator protein AmpE [Hahella sp. CCB-MM4]|uniref:regulatory signaling modulator protein AmpE n=1 Tax=Hahella sp. (strain CCB-MM4) TaxID=1926491 RepID=UPI000B9A2DB1|nr:regulatory signaling modulator protein AmpE [Hahella sp. CCB-MM4]OZG72500.1 regulatory signaling modulator protein AmpE [Hahella sp. CCB-MM4]
MKFLVLLLTFVLQRKLNLTLSRQHDQWARQFLEFFEAKFPVIRHNATLYVVIAILLPAVVLTLVLTLVDDVLFGVATLFVHIVMLFLCLGCGYLKQAVELYRTQWEAEHYQSAFRTLESADIFIKDADKLTPAEVHYQATSQYMYMTFQRYFMVIFWYMVAGPVGALVARLAHVAGCESTTYVPRQVGIVYKVLEWLPARLLALSFALVGNFGETIKSSLNYMIDPAVGALKVLQQAAAGAIESMPAVPAAGEANALRDSRQLVALRDLLNRSVMVWFSVIAILTIVGWMS